MGSIFTDILSNLADNIFSVLHCNKALEEFENIIEDSFFIQRVKVLP